MSYLDIDQGGERRHGVAQHCDGSSDGSAKAFTQELTEIKTGVDDFTTIGGHAVTRVCPVRWSVPRVCGPAQATMGA